MQYSKSLNQSALSAMLILTLIFLSACAAPVPIDQSVSAFVDRKELQVVSLAQEGLALYNNGRFFEAEARLRKALFLDPSLDNVRFNLAITLEKLSLLDESKRLIQSLLVKYPDNYNYLAALARIERQLNNYSSSEKYLIQAAKKAREQEDYLAELNLFRSVISLDLSRAHLEAAICRSEELIQLASEKSLPQSAEIFTQVITLLLSEGKLDRANRLFLTNSASFYADDSPVSLYLRSQILFAQSEFSEVVQLSERTLIIPNLDPVYKFELSILNLLARYELDKLAGSKDQDLFKSEDEIAIYSSLKLNLNSASLTSLYWSPQLLFSAWKILQDPELQEIDK